MTPWLHHLIARLVLDRAILSINQMHLCKSRSVASTISWLQIKRLCVVTAIALLATLPIMVRTCAAQATNNQTRWHLAVSVLQWKALWTTFVKVNLFHKCLVVESSRWGMVNELVTASWCMVRRHCNSWLLISELQVCLMLKATLSPKVLFE